MIQITQTNVAGHKGKLPFVTAISRKCSMMEMVSLFREIKELPYRVTELFDASSCSAQVVNWFEFWLWRLIVVFERPKKLVNNV